MGEANKISITPRRTKLFLCIVAGSFALLLNAAASFAADYRLSYSGRLTQADGAPMAGPVDMAVKFWTDISSGNTLGSQIDYTAVPLNQGVFSLPLVLSSAQAEAIFRDGSEPVFIEVTAAGKSYPRQQYNYVPYALRVPVDGSSVVFDQNGNLGIKGALQASAGSYLTSDGSGAVSWQSPSFGSLTPQSVSASKPSSGQVLTFNGGQWVPQSVSSSGTNGGSVTAGAGLTGGTFTNSGTIALANVGTAGTYAKVVTDAQGRVTLGASLTAADIPPLSAALITSGTLAAANGGTGVNSTATFPTSGVVVTRDEAETLTNKTLSAAVISGASSIGGSTTINTTSTINSGAQTVSGNVTIQGNNTTANKLVLNDKGSANSVSLKAPDNLTSSFIWELPSTAGSDGQVLSTNGSGTLSWTSGAAPTGAASGDLTGNFPGPTVAMVGTSTAANIHNAELAANAATELNTPSKIVKRDGSGNFIAGTITANLTGTASHAASAVSFTGPLVGDVAGTQGATSVASVGGVAAANVASGATLANSAVSINTPSTIIKRDGSGNFTAGTITANLTGTASNATSAVSFTGPLSGDVSGTQGTTVVSAVGTSSAANIHAAELAANAASSSNSSLALVKRDSNGGFSSGQISATTPNATIQGLVVKGSASQSANLQEWQDSSGVVLSAMSSAGYLKLKDSDGTDNFVSLRASPSMAANLTYTLPGTVSAGAYLTTDGSGTLSWSSPGSFSGSLVGDVTGAQGATVVANVGGVTSANVANGADLANAATNANTASTIVKRDGTGNFIAGTITANLTGTASNATSAVSFTGSLAGDVTGTQGVTSVATVGSVSAANVAAGANLAIAATNDNTASTIVRRDGSGNFIAGTITANLTGNVTGNVTGNLTGNASTATLATSATSATSFTAPLAGDVAGNQGSTTVTKLQGRTVANTAPSSGQALMWNGSAWSPQTPASSSSVSIATKSADYIVTAADGGKYFLVSGSNTTLTLPAASSAGAGFTITVKNVSGTTKIIASGSEQIDGSVATIEITNKGGVQIATDGTAWYQVYAIGIVGRGVSCGTNCYTNTTATTTGYAYTASGKNLTLTNGVWVQSDGTNVLRVDGSDNWHYALNANGKSFSTTVLLNKTTANLGGRVCPSSVYVDDTNKVAFGRCLYYDIGNAAQTLNAAGTSQTTLASMGLDYWNVAGTGNDTASSWYEGNIKTCADKGMRLPTLYETGATDPGSAKPADASPAPTFNAASGVPSVSGSSYTWTSSAYTGASWGYWLWSASTANYSYNIGGGRDVRCVVP
ncbi:MAG: hypothetical protein NTY08_10740 [Proteobacteria bacterium]|nr:hypothetical protein [Pseudomonadota bacterium]